MRFTCPVYVPVLVTLSFYHIVAKRILYIENFIRNTIFQWRLKFFCYTVPQTPSVPLHNVCYAR